MKKQTVGMTGSRGVIGSTLINELKEDYNLKLFDKSPNDNQTIQIDLSDKNKLKGLFKGINILIHLAGDPSTMATDESIINNNFIATSNVFNEAQKAGVKKIIYASSNCVHQGDMIKEFQNRLGHWINKLPLDAHFSPKCLYAESKVFGENLGRHLSYSGISFIAMRIGWVFKNDHIPQIINKENEYFKAIYCSNSDLIRAFKKAIEVEADFLTPYIVSNNDRSVFDMTETNKKLGFYPEDNSACI